MNNLPFGIVLANAWGYEPIRIPAKATGYTSAALNVIILAGSCYKLVKRRKQDPLINYIFCLLASILGVIGNIIFYSEKLNGKGFWIFALGYRSFVWLSCLSSFLPLIKTIPQASGCARGTGKFFVYFAYVWAIAGIAVGIYLATIPIDLSRLYSRDYVRLHGDQVLLYIGFVLIAYFETVLFILFYLVLVCTFYKYLKTTPKEIKSISLFGFLEIISVFTDAIAVFAFRTNGVGNSWVVTSIVLNFIFSDLFSTLALFTVLYYCKTWVYTERSVTEGNDIGEIASVQNNTVANELTHY